MIIPNSIAPLTAADHPKVIQLFRRMPRQHIHLDWRALPDWLSMPELRCWVALRDDSIEALLGATVGDAPSSTNDSLAAWLRLAVPPSWGAQSTILNAIWDMLRRDLQREGVSLIALLDIDGWMGRYARAWDFEQTNAVVTLQRSEGRMAPEVSISGVIRDYEPADLEQVARVDAAAFAPLWRYNQDDLAAAAEQAASFTVIERDGKVVAYQLSTQYASSGHLARLAVHPDFQGQMLGGALITKLIGFFYSHGIDLITVNTQADNLKSQKLYTRYGFQFTSHRVPVWTLSLS